MIGRSVPDEIVAAMSDAQIVVVAGDRVADDFVTRREKEAEAFEQHVARRGIDPCLVDDASPDHIARVDRLHVRRQDAAHGGAEAVGRDEHIAALIVPVREMRGDAVRILAEADEGLAKMVAIGRLQRAAEPLKTVP